jgi:phosphate transport system permease protein
MSIRLRKTHVQTVAAASGAGAAAAGAEALSRSERWAGGHAAPGASLAGARPAAHRLLRDRSLTFLIALSVVMTLIPVVWIIVQIVIKGGSAMSWTFLSQSLPFSMMKQGGGFLNGLIGTAIMVGLASVVSIPLGILAAVYLVEYGKGNWLAKLIRFFSDVMTGVPSIFVGVFVYTALVIKFGYGALLGAAALALIMMPIIVRSSEEMLKLVPNELKDASYALGAPKWKTITKVVLPSAAPGLTTGVMLAVARAAGETAPLIMTALGSLQLVTKLTGSPISSLTLLIYSGAGQPFAAAQARAWAGALELLVIVLVFTVAARIMSSRSRVTR